MTPFSVREFRRYAPIWSHLGFRDLRVRYAQTLFGPWLSTVALAAMLLGTSLAVGVLAGTPFREHLSVIAVSLALWMFASNAIIESAELYEVERGLLLNSRISSTVLVFRLLWRNLLVGFHNLPVVVVASGFSSGLAMFRALIFPFALVVTAVMIAGPVFLVARVCLRRRDVARVVPAVVQVLFFVTPILWVPSTSALGNALAAINPLAWPLEICQAFVDHGVLLLSPLIKIALWCGFSIAMLEITSKSSHRDRLRV